MERNKREMDKYFNQKMLKSIFEMYKDIKTSTLKAECIIHYPGNVYSPVSSSVEYEFVKYYAVKAKEPGCQNYTDEMINTLYDGFLDKCNENLKNGKSYLSKNDDCVSRCADQIFISFVRMYHTASQYMDDLERWPAERIARTVLEYMCEYYSEHWKSRKTPDEYFLDCLLTSKFEIEA